MCINFCTGEDVMPNTNNLIYVHDMIDKSGLRDILSNFSGDHGYTHEECLYSSDNHEHEDFAPHMSIRVESRHKSFYRHGGIADEGHYHYIVMGYHHNGKHLTVKYNPNDEYDKQVVATCSYHEGIYTREGIESDLYNTDIPSSSSHAVINSMLSEMNSYFNSHIDEISQAIDSSQFGRYASDSPSFADAMKEAEGYEAIWKETCKKDIERMVKRGDIPEMTTMDEYLEYRNKLSNGSPEYVQAEMAARDERKQAIKEQKSIERKQKFDEFFDNLTSVFKSEDSYSK